MALFAIVPWILFGIMVLFGLIFAIVAWRATRRAGDMEEGAERAQHALSQMEARARAAEGQIAEAQARFYCSCVALALRHVHMHGWVYRDVKCAPAHSPLPPVRTPSAAPRDGAPT